MNNQIFYLLMVVIVGGLMAGSFYYGNYYYEQNQPEPVKAKVLTEFGCVDTTLTIEQYYFQAKLLCSIGECDKVGRICN
ncbi:MAG TPA: hypothetical protein VMX17_15380 [Candidatus Glassbacteria bacterium]|nr:hypothetical protein [Candidatus Glassbacteria bacterium]